MEKDIQKDLAKEPSIASFSESVRNSGLLGQVMSLSPTDKVALIEYLKKDIDSDGPFKTDDLGRIILTKDMKEAVGQAERDLEEGRCLTEESFRERFAKWLGRPSSSKLKQKFIITHTESTDITEIF